MREGRREREIYIYIWGRKKEREGKRDIHLYKGKGARDREGGKERYTFI